MPTLGSQLRTGGPHFGLMMTYPAPGAIERIGPDWDWVWLDGQHGQLGYADILSLVRACDLVARPALVRTPSHDDGAIGLALDTGASGVIVPMVDTTQQARAIVEAAKFPPLGKRSFGGRRPIDRHGRVYAETANTDTLLIAQIETPEGLANVEAIAAVPGVDGLLYGGDDMMLRLGFRMDAPRPKEQLSAELAQVAAACRRHGKIAANVSFSAEMQSMSLSHGYTLMAAGADVAFLAVGSRQSSAQARKLRDDASATATATMPKVATSAGNH